MEVISNHAAFRLFLRYLIHNIILHLTFSASNAVHQVSALLFDPILHPLPPHAKVSERGQGEATQLLPPLSITDGQAFGTRSSQIIGGEKGNQGYVISLSVHSFRRTHL